MESPRESPLGRVTTAPKQGWILPSALANQHRAGCQDRPPAHQELNQTQGLPLLPHPTALGGMELSSN